MSSVEVQIELGHEATPRARPTEQGYTHDWTVYVRGVNGCNIENFVDKVVFNLHESFPKPRRVITKPPYEVSESGYAGFNLIIEVHFKNKEDPKKALFNYDLFLNLGRPASISQIEKLTFQNPSSDLKKKLLKSGGHCIDKPLVSVSTGHGDQRHSHMPSSGKSSKSSLSKDGKEKKSSKLTNLTSVAPSKDKPQHSQQSSHHGPTSSSIAPSSQLSSSTAAQTTTLSSSSITSAHHSTQISHSDKSTNNTSLSQPLQDQFTDLFGIPIRARPSPDSLHSKAKDKAALTSHKSSSKKISSNDSSKSNLSSSKPLDKEKKHKTSSGSAFSENRIEKDKSGKPSKKHDENVKMKKEKEKSSKIQSWDPFSTVTPNSSATYPEKKSSSKESGSNSSNKKRKRADSSSSLPNDAEDKDREFSSFSKSSLSTRESSDKSHKEKSKKQRTSSKDVISSSATTGSNSNQKVKDIKKESSTSTTISLTNNNNTGTTTLEIKSVKKEKTWDSEVRKSRNKEYKSNKEQTGKLDEVKSTRENSNKEIKVRDKDEKERDIERAKEKSKAKSLLESPKESSSARYLKVPKDKLHAPSSIRDPSCSPASNISGSYTPGGGNYMGAPSSASSINCNISGLMAEMEHESLPVSPLSSCDPPSPLTFGSNPPKAKDDSSDGEKELPRETARGRTDNINTNSQKNNTRQPVDKYNNSLVNYNNKRNIVKSEMNDGLNDYHHKQQHILSSPSTHETQRGPNCYDSEYINQLKVLYHKINELRDRDILQKIVDIIEETSLFTITNTAIDFDLMQLDRSTVKKIKLCLSKS